HVNYAVFVVVTHALRLFVVVHSLAPLSTLFPYTTLFRSAHPARGTAPRRRPAVAGRGARLPHPLAARPPPRGLRRPVPRLPQSPARRRRALPRYPHPDGGLSPRDRPARHRAQRWGGRLRPPPPVGRGRAEPCRPGPDRRPAPGARAAGGPCARPPHRGRQPGPVLCRARPGLGRPPGPGPFRTLPGPTRSFPLLVNRKRPS